MLLVFSETVNNLSVVRSIFLLTNNLNIIILKDKKRKVTKKYCKILLL